jgi:hypothetical protein
MRVRQRKLVGTFATVGFLTLYCLIAMALGGALVVGRPPAVEIAYFVVAGIAWLPAVMIIIRWMSRPDAG